MHAAYPAVRGRGAGIALAAAGHVLLAWFLLTSAPSDRHAQAPARSGPAIGWLLPQAAPVPARAAARPEPAAPARRAPRRRPASVRTAEAVEAVTVPMEAPLAEPTPAPAMLPAREEAARAPIDPARLVRDLKLSGMASGLDAKGKGSRDAAAMTLEAKLAAGFERAHAAGDTGWLKSMGMEEISSTDGNGTRVYRMRNALGTYCVFVKNDGSPPVSGKCR